MFRKHGRHGIGRYVGWLRQSRCWMPRLDPSTTTPVTGRITLQAPTPCSRSWSNWPRPFSPGNRASRWSCRAADPIRESKDFDRSSHHPARRRQTVRVISCPDTWRSTRHPAPCRMRTAKTSNPLRLRRDANCRSPWMPWPSMSTRRIRFRAQPRTGRCHFWEDRKRGYRTDITKWGDIGLDNGWESHPIHLYGRDKKSGTRAFFLREALADGGMKSGKWWRKPGSATEILDISRDPLGNGICRYRFSKLPPFAWFPRASREKDYDTYRRHGPRRLSVSAVSLSVREEAPGAKCRSEVREFLKFVNSREGQETVARAGFFRCRPLKWQRILKRYQVPRCRRCCCPRHDRKTVSLSGAGRSRKRPALSNAFSCYLFFVNLTRLRIMRRFAFETWGCRAP